MIGRKCDKDNVLMTMGIGIMAQCCHNITVCGCSVTAQNGRYVSSGADATHFFSCTGQITVEDCLFEHMLDDSLNVHGVYLKIYRAESGRCIVKFCNSATSGIDLFQPGDRVCQMNPHTLIPEKEATVIEVCKINNVLTELTFSEPIKLTEGYIIENLTKYPTLNLRRCIIRNNRARGILIATKHSVIEECEFHTGGSAIVLECDGVFWYESGAVKDILIRNNHFDSCKHATWGKGVVYIPPREQTIPQKYYHGCITMAGNTFNSCFDDILYAENAAESVYEDNSSKKAQILHLKNIGKIQLQSEAVLAE